MISNFEHIVSKTVIILLLLVLISCSDHSADLKNSNGSEKPDPSRFSYRLMAEGLEEPIQLEFDNSGFVYWIERVGHIKRLEGSSGRIEHLGTVALTQEEAPGLAGILLDKEFEKTRQFFIYYSAEEDQGNFMRLSRFSLSGDDKIDMGSEVIVLKIPWEQPDGHHFGGGMTWDREGNLFLAIGGDSAPTQYSPLPFTNLGGRGEDEGRTAGNTNDLRGSILRIRPQSDGTYTIPEGNLFPKDTPNTLPEIYVMGNRNPWRLSIDTQTGYLHWGEVGPDAGLDSEEYGPMGYDEFNVAKQAGNFGWPYLIGKNLPYKSYNYETGTYGEPYNPDSLVNTSPNNTGLKELPPGQPALIAYPYRVSDEWPILGSAARSAVGGPVFRRADYSEDAERVFPDYFEGKWLITDYVRNWIMVVSMDERRNEVESIERFLPAEQLMHSQPLDMDFGPNGDLYLIEYGIGNTGRVSRIEYNAGNRAPVAHASTNQTSGVAPLKAQLSSEGTYDNDGDALTYEWTITLNGDIPIQKFTKPHPEVKLEKQGIYQINLTVSDPHGAMDTDTFEIVAGNEKPQVQFDITSGNKTFYFPNKTITYKLHVTDHEDGSLADGSIKMEDVVVTADYIPSGISMDKLLQLDKEGNLGPKTELRHLNAKTLITQNNCNACHMEDSPLVGPSFIDVAHKYIEVENVFPSLSKSIMEGSSGKWGDTPMPPHPALTPSETNQIIDYILDLANSEQENLKLSEEGEFKTAVFEKKERRGRLSSFFSTPYEMGSYVFFSSYTDKGSDEINGLNLTGNDFVLLRYPLLSPESADFFSEEGYSFTPSTNDPGFIFTGKGGFIGFKDIDLTGINLINIGAINRFWHWSHFIGATIELRLGSAEGELIGAPYQVPPAPADEKGPFFGAATGKPVPVDVSIINGIHDLYIIVHNQSAGESDALVIMTGIEFNQ